ncbi:MAG: hypothetical protein R3257_07910, partial [bacterium]|nr:hypothetical protein [bacterium]
SLGVGGTFPSPKGTLELGGWKAHVAGTVKEVEFSQGAESFEKLKAAWPAEQESKGDSEKFNQQLGKIFLEIGDFLQNLKVKISSQELGWDGVKYVGSEGQELVLVKPVHVQGKISEEDGNLVASGKGNLEEVRFLIKGERPVSLRDLSFTQRAFYQNTNFSKLIEFVLSYYKNLFSESVSADYEKKFEGILFSSLAQYPNEADFKFSIGNLDYRTKELDASHKELYLEFFVNKNQAGYRIGDSFTLKYPQSPEKNIINGRGTGRLIFKFPWDAMINISRQAILDTDISLDFFDIFGKQAAGIELGAFVDLGPNYFLSDLFVDFSLPLGQALEGIKLPREWKDWSKFEKLGETIRTRILQVFLKQGVFYFKFKIERLSKLQAWLESMKSGSSLGLAVLAPYTHIDTEKDSLTMNIEFKDSIFLVNGAPSPSLLKLIEPVFLKWGVKFPEQTIP